MDKSNIDVYNSYYNRKVGGGSNYNFELEPLINNFSFIDFISEGIEYQYDDYGAFLVITDKQYIIGYNAGFGVGGHHSAFARVFKDICGGGTINNDRDMVRLCSSCKSNFLIARIVFEKVYDDCVGCIRFIYPKDGITAEQFTVFEKFYEDYNKEISLTVRRYGIRKFNVCYEYSVGTGTKRPNISDSLDNFRDFIRYWINPDKKVDISSERIIGVVPNAASHKK